MSLGDHSLLWDSGVTIETLALSRESEALSGTTDSPSPTLPNKQLRNRTRIISAGVQLVEVVATTAAAES